MTVSAPALPATFEKASGTSKNWIGITIPYDKDDSEANYFKILPSAHTTVAAASAFSDFATTGDGIVDGEGETMVYFDATALTDGKCAVAVSKAANASSDESNILAVYNVTATVTTTDAYLITKEAATNGSYTVEVGGEEASAAIKGQLLTIRTTPDAAYTTGAVTVNSNNATVVNATTYTYTMPEATANVAASFTSSTVPTGGSTTQGDNPVELTANGAKYYFADLAGALANQADGRTVKLLKPVDTTAVSAITSAMTLDLNGQTITLKQTSGTAGVTVGDAATIKNGTVKVDSTASTVTAGSAIQVSAAGKTVTIDNVKVAGAGQLLNVADGAVVSSDSTYTATDPAADKTAVSIVKVAGANAAKLTMETGSISDVYSGSVNTSRGMSGIEVGDKAEVVLGKENGGSAPSVTVQNPAIKVDAGTDAATTKLTVNSGTYTSTYAQETGTTQPIVEGKYAVSLDDYATVNLKGGTFSAPTYAVNGGSQSANVALNISGGTYKYTRTDTATYPPAVLNLPQASTVEITGGDFRPVTNAVSYTAASAGAASGKALSKSVKGGTFGAALTDNEAAAGYAPTGTEPGPYSVTKTLKGIVPTVDQLTYNGSSQKPVVHVVWPAGGTDELVQDTDYTVGYYTDQTCTQQNYVGTELTSTTSASQLYYAKVTPVNGRGFDDQSAVSAGIVVNPVAITDPSVTIKLCASDGDQPVDPDKYTTDWTGTTVAAPKAVVYVNGTEVPAAGNYSVAIQANGVDAATYDSANPPTARVTVSANSTLLTPNGTKDVFFNISGVDISSAAVKMQAASADYDTANHQPTIESVILNGTTAITAYSATWYDPDGNEISSSVYGTTGFKSAGTYTVKITPTTSQQYGTATGTYTINKRDISGSTATLTATSATWDNQPVQTSALINSVTYKYAEGGAAQNIAGNYSVSPATISAPGTYTIKLSGTNNFEGELTVGTYVMNKGSFDGMTLSNSSFTYNPDAAANVEVATLTNSSLGSTYASLVAGTDYTLAFYAKTGTSQGKSTYDATKPLGSAPSDVGDYVAVATGTGDWTGTAQADFSISAINVGTYSALAAGFHNTSVFKKATFTGEAINVADYIESLELTQVTGTAPNLEYTKHEFPAGTYSVYPAQITEKEFNGGSVTLYFDVTGNYAGQFTGTLTVAPAVLSEAAEVAAIDDATYTAAAQAPTVLVTNKASGAALTAGTDYQLTDVILGAEQEDGSISYEVADGATLKHNDGTLSDLKDAGTYRITVASKAGGAFAGVPADADEDANLYAYYTIKPADINDVTGLTKASMNFAAQPYQGKEFEPTATFTSSSAGTYMLGTADVTNELQNAGTALEFTKVQNVGTYKVGVSGTGNYTGELPFTYDVTVSATAATASNVVVQFKVGEGETAQWVDGNSSTSVYYALVNTNPDYRVAFKNGTKYYPLTEGTDYSVEVTGKATTSTNGGKVTVTPIVSDKSNISGTTAIEAVFGVTDKTLANSTLTFSDGAEVTYKTGGYTPTTTLKLADGSTLRSGIDYDVTVYDGEGAMVNTGLTALTDADTYTVIAVGKGFAGSKSATFTINKLDLSTGTLEGVTKTTDNVELEDVVYTGTARTLAFDASSKIKFENGTEISLNALSATSAVKAAYNGTNVDAGTATLAVEPNSGDTTGVAKNLDSALTFDFAIAQADFADFYDVQPALIVDGDDSTPIAKTYKFNDEYYFTGEKVVPAVQVLKKQAGNPATPATAAQVKAGTATVLDPSEYTLVPGENFNAGAATVVAVPKEGGNFTSSATYHFMIRPVPFDEEHVTVGGLDDVVYNGSAQKPVTAKIANGTYTLKENTDYIIGYENNIDAGTATATLVGMGGQSNFTGKAIVKTFNIVGADLTNAEITLDNDGKSVYTGKAITPKVTAVTLNGEPVKDFVADVQSGTDVGTYKVTVTSNDKNYSGSASTTWQITKAVNPVTAKVAASAIAVKGTTQITSSGKGTVSYTSSNKSIATVDSKGKVTGVKAGTATITVEYKNDKNYANGKATVTVTVKKANTAKVTVAKGKTKKKAATVKAKKKATIKGAVTVKSAKGTVKVANKSTNKVAKSFKVAYKSGKVNVTVPKNKVAKGKTYLVKVQVTAAGNGSYMPFSKTVKVYVKGTK